jgi:hypothetical protein
MYACAFLRLLRLSVEGLPTRRIIIVSASREYLENEPDFITG